MEDLTQYRLRKLEDSMQNLPEKVSNLEGKVNILITINVFALMASTITLGVVLVKLFTK